MAFLYVSEFSNLPFVSNGVIQAPAAHDWVTDQQIGISGTSAPSAAFNIATNYIMIESDVICSIAWTMAGAGSVLAATTANFRIPANVPMIFGVAPGMKISVITNT